MAAMALVKLAKLTGQDRYLSAAEDTMRSAVALIEQYPSAMAQMLIAIDLYLGPTYEFVLAGQESPEMQNVLQDIHTRFIPNKVLAQVRDEVPAALRDLLRDKELDSEWPTLYICEGFTCRAPASGPEEIALSLDELAPF
jgi:uncharacterized protein YyaL (SSP411 family)